LILLLLKTPENEGMLEVAERWVKSARTECLDHLFVFNEVHLRRAMSAYVAYFNHWRPHRSLGPLAPCDLAVLQFRPREANCKITASLFWADCITFISVLHDGRYFCALQVRGSLPELPDDLG
jgi:hypothetical protein